jgi:hypothetical protein
MTVTGIAAARSVVHMVGSLLLCEHCHYTRQAAARSEQLQLPLRAAQWIVSGPPIHACTPNVRQPLHYQHGNQITLVTVFTGLQVTFTMIRPRGDAKTALVITNSTLRFRVTRPKGVGAGAAYCTAKGRRSATTVHHMCDDWVLASPGTLDMLVTPGAHRTAAPTRHHVHGMQGPQGMADA